MSLQVTPQAGALALAWDMPKGAYGAIVKYRAHGAIDFLQMLSPASRHCTISGLQPVLSDVQVLLLSTTGLLALSASATPLPSDPPTPISSPVIS